MRRYWLALYPDTQKIIGGVKQMHRLAEGLNTLGMEASIIQDNASFHPGWFRSSVSTVDKSSWSSNSVLAPSTDIVVLPETYITVLATYKPGLPKVIYNQNGHYTFGSTKKKSPLDPEKIVLTYNHPDVVHVLCVSHYDSYLLHKLVGIPLEKLSVIPNSIEEDLFYYSTSKDNLISYMVRKNSSDAHIVASLLRMQPWLKDWSIEVIDGLSQEGVAKQLRRTKIFLSFGHPEGFGLPVAEAMACGCFCIGYSGLGGRELFHVAERQEAGKTVEFGDWCGFIDGVQEFTTRKRISPKEMDHSLQLLSAHILSMYSRNSQITSISSAVSRIESQLLQQSKSI